MNREYIDELIIGFICDEIGERERMELEAWIQACDENKLYFNQMSELWETAGINQAEQRFDPRQAFKEFKKGRFKHPNISRIWRYTAIAAALAIISFASFKLGQADLEKTFDNIIVEAPIGSESVMTLPDGTRVVLNACSSLKYSQGFGIKDRNVELIGECYFEVERNESLPFNVKSKHIKVQVLGTKFNFRDYPDEMEAAVSLIEGRVALQNLIRTNDDIKYLSQNQQVVFNKTTNDMRIDSKDAEKAISWKSGVLFFDEVMLCDIAKELQRTYDVNISIQSKELSQMRVYGSFLTKEQKVEDILNLLTATNNLRYTMHGRDVKIYN